MGTDSDTVYLMPDASGRPRRFVPRDPLSPPPEPHAVWPVEGSRISADLFDGGRVEIHWSGAERAAFVWVEVADSPAFRPRLRAERFVARDRGEFWLPPRAMPYFFRIRAEGDNGGLSPWSRPVSFRVVRADDPIPKSRSDYWSAAESAIDEDLLMQAVSSLMRRRQAGGPGKAGSP